MTRLKSLIAFLLWAGCGPPPILNVIGIGCAVAALVLSLR